MIPLWSPRNEEHLAKHNVMPLEAMHVIAQAKPPYPEESGDDKWTVHGPTKGGRLLQVIFVYATIEDIEPDEYLRLRLDERLALEQGEEAFRVIHARDLTTIEKRRLRRRGR